MARLRQIDAKRRRDTDNGDFLEGLARGLRVVGAFNADRRQMTLSDVARAVDLPRATVRRALFTLDRLGFVETDGRLFRLTPRILQLAAAYLRSNSVSTVLQPACERITRELREACSAAVLDGAEVVMIAHASPQRFIAVGPGVGFRLPAFCTSLGRVLLAAFPDERLDAFLDALEPRAETPHTVTSKRKLRELIRRARADGYALVDQEAELGFRSVAVPIRRYDGTVVAAMNVGVQVERASVERMRKEFLPRLLDVATDLQAQLI
jgi:IclR family pca regulon transcriptional regulator